MDKELDIAIRSITRTLLAADNPGRIYRTILDMVQKPMIDEVMMHYRGNQCRASRALSINRGTLRGKLTKISKQRDEPTRGFHDPQGGNS